MAVTPSLAVSAEPELGSAEAAPASALAPAEKDEVSTGGGSVCFFNAARKVVSKCSSFGGLDRNIFPKSTYCCVQMIVIMDSINCCLPLLQVPLGVRKRRTPRSANGQVIANPFDCRCSEGIQQPVVSGTGVGAATGNVTASFVSSVVAALKHVSVPVCAWDETDLDEVQAEGIRLSRSVVELWQTSAAKRKEFCMLFEQQSVFGRMWSVCIGPPELRHFDMRQESELYQELQEKLLSDGMCLLDIQGSPVAVIHHKDYFVVVDSGARNALGLACSYGRSVAVFNTCLNDLMLHIMALKKSLGAQWYAVISLSVKTDDVTVNAESATDCGDSDVDTSVAAEVVEDCSFVSPESAVCSVRGTFHQGDDRFTFGGQQCMAISLVGMATHAVHSVFSWGSDRLDNVVVSGDKLYTGLRDSRLSTDESYFLAVPELPTEFVVDGHNLEFVYGDYVQGHADVDEGEFIAAGVHTTLKCGLEKMCIKYDTCFLTLGASTCAIIRQDGRYAVVDSHARSVDGMVDENGRSVVVYFPCFDRLYHYICRLSKAVPKGHRQFEIASVCVSRKGSTEEVSLGPRVDVDSKGDDVVCLSPKTTVVSSSIKKGVKRKVAWGSPCVSKWVKISDVAVDGEADVVFVADVQGRTLQFNPLCSDVAQGVCKKLNVKSEKADAVSFEVGELGVPCKKDKIVADGNCFFRAVSQAVCGTQQHHKKVRSCVFKQLEKNAGEYESGIRMEYSSMSEYLSLSKIKYVGSWATELEIQAAADFLGVNIFTYHDKRWLEYTCRSNVLSNQGIYLGEL